ncbi:hypothetical protein N0V82_007796 [Gnomoniopsis sp. IMI 355080]|nr:hypothetical protein N0V82_007796 [Gnomoniopsis sp. IMI 355080]
MTGSPYANKTLEMAPNINPPVEVPVEAAVEAPVDAPPELPSWVSPTTPFKLKVGWKASETKPQNRRIFNVLQALMSQQTTTGDASKQSQEGAAASRNERKRKHTLNGEGDNTEASSSKQTCTTTASSRTKDLSNIAPHANEVAIPNRNASSNIIDGGRGRDEFELEDRLLGFLRNIPGWGPSREASPVVGASPFVDSSHNAGGYFNAGDQDLEFTMDDLFDFDYYYAP